MSPEKYEIHCKRVPYLSEHPLIERDAGPRVLEERTRQLTLEEVAK